MYCSTYQHLYWDKCCIHIPSTSSCLYQRRDPHQYNISNVGVLVSILCWYPHSNGICIPVTCTLWAPVEQQYRYTWYQYRTSTHTAPIIYCTHTRDGTSSIDACSVPVSLLYCPSSHNLLVPILVHNYRMSVDTTILYTYNTCAMGSMVKYQYWGQFWYFGTTTGTELDWYI